MRTATATIAILALIATAPAHSAQCQGVDGKWYDYSSPQCSGSGPTGQRGQIQAPANPKKRMDIIEQGAVISDSVSDKQIEAAVWLVKREGYRCDSVYSGRPMLFESGFVLHCNGARYSYEIRDKGGKPEIAVK